MINFKNGEIFRFLGYIVEKGGAVVNRARVIVIIFVLFLSFFLLNIASAENEEIEETACELLALCQQAIALYYNEEVVLPSYPEKHALVTTLRGPSRDDLLGFISETPTRVFVVLRGSQSVTDLKRDLRCVKVPFYLVPNGGRVHHGFMTAYTRVGEGRCLSLRKFILQTLAGLDPTKKLYVTGHSMGGALATLCALDVAEHSPFSQPSLYTFASPRVGDRIFVKKFDSAITTSVRIRNVYDFIPDIPLKCMGYDHVKGNLVIKVKTSKIDSHRLISAYLPGIVAQFNSKARGFPLAF